MSDNPTVDIEKTVALREAEASRNELEQRVARAMLNCAAWSSFWSEDDALVLAQAALKAHAEWLAEQKAVRPQHYVPPITQP